MDAAIMTRLDEITHFLKEVKSEYSIIRKEILGVRVSDSTTNSQRMGLLESKTLREIVDETQFQLSQISSKILDNERQIEIMENVEAECQVESNKVEEDFAETPEEFPVVEIQRKSLDQERNWMKEKFNEIKQTARNENGESLRGTTVEAISKSIIFSDNVKSSCVIVLSNYLDSDLTHPQYHFWYGSKINGPSRVGRGHQEVLSFAGDTVSCSFLCSFRITPILRLAIRCVNSLDGCIFFGIGFTPADVPTDEEMFNRLRAMPEVPDVRLSSDVFNFFRRGKPVELFVSHENFVVRGQMSSLSKSLVQIEILEMNPENMSTRSGNQIKSIVDNGRSIQSQGSYQNSVEILRSLRNYGKFACDIEIVNCLSVTLRNGGKFYCKCEKNDFLPLDVFPFERETFFGADEANVEAMFSYEIDSTDLAIVVALKVGRNLNAFAASFVRIKALAVAGAKQVEVLMDSNLWNIHDYSKYVHANEGTQLIRMGNIRAEMRMTEEKHSLFKIKVFAI